MRSVRRLLLFPLLATVLTLPAAAQSLPPAMEAEIDKIFEPWTKPGSPGAAVALVHNGVTVYQKGFGLANVELNVPITPQSVFYLGSVGKQFTALAIALLEADGKLSVGDDIRKYVPEIPDYGTPITIDHLLHHTSGIRDYLELTEMAELDIGYYRSDAEVLNLLGRQKALNFTPGDEYLYSNSGYFLLGVIVHRVSGKTLREFAAERIFEPLGMTSTHIHDDYTHLIPNRASSYIEKEDGTLMNFISQFDRVGSGGVYASLEDMVRWDRNFYSYKVGGPQVVQRLHTRGVLNDGTHLDYAFGLVITSVLGQRVVEHSGGLGGYRTYLGRAPDLGFSVIVLANLSSIDPRELGLRASQVYFADFLPQPPATAETPPSEEAPDETAGAEVPGLDAYAGVYFEKKKNLIRRLLVRDGQLVYQRSEDHESVLVPLGENAFKMLTPFAQVEVRFEPGKMIVDVAGEGTSALERVKEVHYTDEDLAAFTGRYYSEELDVDTELKVEDGALTLRGRTGATLRFTPRFADYFSNDGVNASFHFQRGEDGRPTEFTVSSGRVRGILYVRQP